MSFHEFIWWWHGVGVGVWLIVFLAWLAGIWPDEVSVAEKIRLRWSRHKERL